MSKAAEKVDVAVIREGWKTLVKKMGMVKATRFLVAFGTSKRIGLIDLSDEVRPASL